MKKFLVPIDSLKTELSTLRYAIELAAIHDADVYSVQFEKLKDKSDMDAILAFAEEKDVSINFRPLEGDIFTNINSLTQKLAIDLIIFSPSMATTNSDLFLGKVAGKVVKEIDLPVLIIPAKYDFKPINKVLMTIKSGKIERDGVLDPLEAIVKEQEARMHLLQIKTPGFKVSELEYHKDLAAIASFYTTSENATIFQGVLEHLKDTNPDMLCVIRRNRGFFSKLWEQNTVKKIDFESRIPLLILKGAK